MNCYNSLVHLINKCDSVNCILKKRLLLLLLLLLNKTYRALYSQINVL